MSLQSYKKIETERKHECDKLSEIIHTGSLRRNLCVRPIVLQMAEKQ